MNKTFSARFLNWMGWQSNTTSHIEKIVSALGGFVGIISIYWVSNKYLGNVGAAMMVASMGASAVLLFAVPHGALSQPWAVVGGHLISAVIGVSIVKLVPDPLFSAPLAVGAAIGAMHYTRCIHPPGGATALSFAIGGPSAHALGYLYVIEPVMINTAVILSMAILFNYGFAWRRYPVAWRKPEPEKIEDDDNTVLEVLNRKDLEFALKSLDLTLDITERDLEKLFVLANHHAHLFNVEPEELHIGGYYSNGQYGDDWEVRHIVDEVQSSRMDEDIIRYNVVAGRRRHVRESAKRLEFARWARYEVYLNENSWERVTPDEQASAK